LSLKPLPPKQALLGDAREARDAMLASLRDADPAFGEELDREAAVRAAATAEAEEAEAAHGREAAAAAEAARRLRSPCPDCGGFHSEDE
jgi:hypothetical protein